MLTALGRLEELETHLSLTPNSGVSRDEVKEVLMQAAIYAGVPAAMSAFNRANKVFAEMDQKGKE
jgi:4-carboxymuconolactone decarboxylase